jgi:hypothetical protein
VALGQVFSEYFGFPCNRRSLHQLLHNHPHVSSGECTVGQCGRSAGTYRDLGDLKQRDLRKQNLGDLKRDLRGLKSHPTKKPSMILPVTVCWFVGPLARGAGIAERGTLQPHCRT